MRGDAIAAIVYCDQYSGGFLIGLVRKEWIFNRLCRHTVLTVGDGLVTQIPALLVSTSAGIVSPGLRLTQLSAST